ncbi:GDSL-type esterase/lipase family protein [Clostridium sp.]|uniref:GDSL-type esterase/lipase family protein n=1 Tax=Clostridium sp. TaxID=1506 RepID=UPI003FD80D02
MFEKSIKKILIVSLTLNILCLSIGGLLVYKKGEISFNKSKSATVFNSNIKKSYSKYYIDKVKSFNNIKKTNEILFVGDSLTDYCNWNILFSNINIENLGISGDHTGGVLNRTNSIYNLKPSKVFIMIGTNDLSSGINKETIVSNYVQIIKDIKKNSSKTEIFVQSILPINQEIIKSNGSVRNEKNEDVVSLNGTLKEKATQLGVKYINLYDLFTKSNKLNEIYTIDGIHLDRQGYSIWKQAIEKYVTVN